jgi:hypothetical protein
MTYWVSAYELSWYLETSVPRIVTVLVLICAAAVVHLSGLFLMTLGRPFEGAPPNNQEASTRVAGANG